MRNRPKRTISAGGGLGLLQMISKPVCASEDARPFLRGVDCEIPHRLEREQVPARTLDLKKGWIMRSHWLETRTKHCL